MRLDVIFALFLYAVICFQMGWTLRGFRQPREYKDIIKDLDEAKWRYLAMKMQLINTRDRYRNLIKEITESQHDVQDMPRGPQYLN